MNLQDHFKAALWDDVWGWLEDSLVEDVAQAPEVPTCSIGNAVEALKARYERAFEEARSLRPGEARGIVWVGPPVFSGGEGLAAYVVDPSEADPIDAGDLPWEHVLSCEVSGYCEAARDSGEMAAAALRELCRFGFTAEEAKRGRKSWASELEERLRQSEGQIEAGECVDGEVAMDEIRRKLGLRPSSPESRSSSRYRAGEQVLVSLVRRCEMAEALAYTGWAGFSWPADFEAAFAEAVERVLPKNSSASGS